MPTLDDVRHELDKDELNYPALAKKLGEGALPQLEEIVHEDEPRLASKAAYLAGQISGPTSDRVVALAAGSRHDVVRVSAAAAIPLLPADQVTGIATRLLGDPDSGVRARAAKSAVGLSDPGIAKRLRAMATDDDEPDVRDLAAGLARGMPGG